MFLNSFLWVVNFKRKNKVREVYNMQINPLKSQSLGSGSRRPSSPLGTANLKQKEIMEAMKNLLIQSSDDGSALKMSDIFFSDFSIKHIANGSSFDTVFEKLVKDFQILKGVTIFNAESLDLSEDKGLRMLNARISLLKNIIDLQERIQKISEEEKDSLLHNRLLHRRENLMALFLSDLPIVDTEGWGASCTKQKKSNEGCSQIDAVYVLDSEGQAKKLQLSSSITCFNEGKNAFFKEHKSVLSQIVLSKQFRSTESIKNTTPLFLDYKKTFEHLERLDSQSELDVKLISFSDYCDVYSKNKDFGSNIFKGSRVYQLKQFYNVDFEDGNVSIVGEAAAGGQPVAGDRPAEGGSGDLAEGGSGDLAEGGSGDLAEGRSGDLVEGGSGDLAGEPGVDVEDGNESIAGEAGGQPIPIDLTSFGRRVLGRLVEDSFVIRALARLESVVNAAVAMVSVSATPAAGTVTTVVEGSVKNEMSDQLPVANPVGRPDLYVQAFPSRSQPGLPTLVVPVPNLTQAEPAEKVQPEAAKPPVKVEEVTLEPAATAATLAVKEERAKKLALKINKAVAESAEAKERAEAESAEDRRQRAKAERAKNKKQTIKLAGVQLTEEPEPAATAATVEAKWLEANVVEVVEAEAKDNLFISIDSLDNAKQIVGSVLKDGDEKNIIIQRIETHLQLIREIMAGVNSSEKKRLASKAPAAVSRGVQLAGSTASDVINIGGIEDIKLFAKEVKTKAKRLKEITPNRTAFFNKNRNQAFKEGYASLMELLDDKSQYEEFDIEKTAAEAVSAGKERKVGKRPLTAEPAAPKPETNEPEPAQKISKVHALSLVQVLGLKDQERYDYEICVRNFFRRQQIDGSEKQNEYPSDLFLKFWTNIRVSSVLVKKKVVCYLIAKKFKGRLELHKLRDPLGKFVTEKTVESPREWKIRFLKHLGSQGDGDQEVTGELVDNLIESFNLEWPNETVNLITYLRTVISWAEKLKIVEVDREVFLKDKRKAIKEKRKTRRRARVEPAPVSDSASAVGSDFFDPKEKLRIDDYLSDAGEESVDGEV